jgi:hypothetical protein
MPAAIILSSTSREPEVGPVVQTILVLKESLSTMITHPSCAIPVDSNL